MSAVSQQSGDRSRRSGNHDDFHVRPCFSKMPVPADPGRALKAGVAAIIGDELSAAKHWNSSAKNISKKARVSISLKLPISPGKP
jgi:hypothetical protein